MHGEDAHSAHYQAAGSTMTYDSCYGPNEPGYCGKQYLTGWHLMSTDTRLLMCGCLVQFSLGDWSVLNDHSLLLTASLPSIMSLQSLVLFL